MAAQQALELHPVVALDLMAYVGEQRRLALRVDRDLLLHRRHRAVDHLLQVVTDRDQDPESLLLDRFAVSDRLQNSARHRTPPFARLSLPNKCAVTTLAHRDDECAGRRSYGAAMVLEVAGVTVRFGGL